jgi:hypothetical protein
LVGVAVNVTDVPAHIGDGVFAAMVTDGIVSAFTVIVMLLLNAVFVLVQIALLVISTLTISPVTSEELENVLLFVPTEFPFTVQA